MRGLRELTCIICPFGCRARVVLEGDRLVSVGGVECPRGEKYAVSEITAPVRDFFTTVRVVGGVVPVLPVRTSAPVPKGRVMDCSRALAGVVVRAPVRLGDVVVRDLLGLGVDVVSTRDVEAAK